jgi:hypothetical protein
MNPCIAPRPPTTQQHREVCCLPAAVVCAPSMTIGAWNYYTVGPKSSVDCSTHAQRSSANVPLLSGPFAVSRCASRRPIGEIEKLRDLVVRDVLHTVGYRPTYVMSFNCWPIAERRPVPRPGMVLNFGAREHRLQIKNNGPPKPMPGLCMQLWSFNSLVVHVQI